MDLQAVLNATAQIAGGALKQTGVYQGAGGITGVRIAYSLYKDLQAIADDGLVHISLWDGMQVNPSGTVAGPDEDVYRHRIRMELMLAPGRSDLAKAHSILTPFVPLYMAAFNSNLKLLGSCQSSRFDTSDIAAAVVPNRIALRLFLIATQKEAVTRAA